MVQTTEPVERTFYINQKKLMKRESVFIYTQELKSPHKWIKLFFCLNWFILLNGQAMAAGSDSAPPAWEPLGSPSLVEWKGIHVNKNEAVLHLPGTATFQYPAGSKGWYNIGFRKEHDGTKDWRAFYGLQADVWVPQGSALELIVTLFTPKPELQQQYLPEAHATVTVAGGGWQRITLPWSIFDVPDYQTAMFKFIQGVSIAGKFKNGSSAGNIRLKNIRLTRALQVAMDAPVRGKAVAPGETANYTVTLTNCTNATQEVALAFMPDKFKIMQPSIQPAQVSLASGASAICVVSVKVPQEGVAVGGHERQQLIASANGSPLSNNLTFITAREVPHPNVFHTAARWEEVRDKVIKYDWAKLEEKRYISAADRWEVPEAALPPNNYNANEKHAFVFTDQNFARLLNAVYAWQLTRNKKYAEKVALFLRRLTDEKTGYPSTLAATNNGGPQEGDDFQRIAIAYDGILDAGILDNNDRKAIEHTMRLYMETFEPDLTVGNMGNWSTAQSTGALFCALAMGDLVTAERYIYGPAGFTDFLSKGVMDDGWWWEVSTSYNLWVASELTQAALACQPWGIDLINLEVPANYAPYAITNPWALSPPYGISFEKWGPQRSNTRSIKRFWDAIPKVADYRGIVFGMNDGHEEKVGDQRMELAYYVYRDPAYATLIKLTGQRDLFYGVPELPKETPELYSKSAYAENIGYALLRSQTKGRLPREQIQAVLKIGTQGGYHGHFDRVSLDNLTRYGRSFWNPESIWWGYSNFMYKFYVQSSVNHNMVVVDQKQQEAVPSTQLLFHSGPMMQVAAQQTNARWSDPPYLGMQYFADETPADQMRKNKQTIPAVTDRKYGELGPFSERILQRRLAIVTDDYVILADYLKGTQSHTFDNLFQMKALTSLTAKDKPLQIKHHDAQFSNDPHNAAQFITDANWYATNNPALAKFEFAYGPNADNRGSREILNEPGILKIDVHTLWPQHQELMVAMPPETHDSQQWINYKVTGDGKILTSGESGTWILGAQTIDVPVTGLSELNLEVSTTGGKKKSLFWANARLVDINGKETPLGDLTDMQNIELPAIKGLDYYGGPIKIAGMLPSNTIPSQSANSKLPAVIRIPLAGKNAVRFKATIGGDYPFGPEEARRKVFDIRAMGTEARFLTILEPYDNKAMIRSATALSADHIQVELTDGRIQDILINNMEGNGANLQVTIEERKNTKIIRSENTKEN